MRLLIVTPTLGSSAFFKQTVESVAAYAPFATHIVVCPGSVVSTMQGVCRDASIVAEPPDVGGLYGAVNHGVGQAPQPWEWLTYINDDDVLLPGFVEALGRVSPDDGIGYGRVDKIDERGNRVGGISTLLSPRWFLPLASAGISGFNQQGVLIHRRVWETVGPFDPRFRICADFDFFVRAARAGARLRYLRTTTGAFRIRRGQISHDIAVEAAEKQRIYLSSGLGQYARAAVRAKWFFRVQNSHLYLRRLLRVELRTSHQMLADGDAGKSCVP